MKNVVDWYIGFNILNYLTKCDRCNCYDIINKQDKCEICNHSFCIKCKHNLNYCAARDEVMRRFCDKCYNM